MSAGLILSVRWKRLLTVPKRTSRPLDGLSRPVPQRMPPGGDRSTADRSGNEDSSYSPAWAEALSVATLTFTLRVATPPVEVRMV